MDAISPEVSGGFMNNIGPGGKYYRYSQIVVVILALTFLTLVSFLAWPYLSGTKNQTPPTLTLSSNNISKPTPPPETPTPYVLPSGKQVYRISNGKDVKGPKIAVLTIDPLDPKKGTTQTFTMEVESESAVNSVQIVVTSDTKENTVNLKLTSGDTLKGTYSGSLLVEDTYDTKYFLRTILKNATETNDNVMSIR